MVNKGDLIYKLDNVSKIYNLNKIEVPALNGVSFDIHKKEIIAFIGPSGSGKSTLLHLLGTIDTPTNGKVYFEDKDVSSLKDAELSKIRSVKIGFIFQNFNLIPILSVYENVEYPLKLRKISNSEHVKEKITRIIEEVGLSDYIHHKPGELSGGQKQRVAIARALVIEPLVILADEPTANLDSKTGIKILEIIRELSVKHNSTVVFSTHDAKVMDYVEKKVMIEDGRIKDIIGNR